MFYHNFKYTLKILLKDRALIFWTIFWPLILGTMFYLAFSNISSAEKLNTINLGIVNNTSFKENNSLVSTFKDMSDKSSKNYMFDIKYGSLDKEKELLEDKKIDGYIYITDKTTKIFVKENGINQTIIKYVIDEINEYDKVVNSIIDYKMATYKKVDVSKIYKDVLKDLNNNKSYVNNISSANMDYMVIEFYTLIAMTCLFGALMTSTVISNYLANINKKGARVTLAPVSRMTLLLGGLLASFIVQLISIGSVLIYTHYILGIDYGNRFNLVILLAIIGSVAGNALGLFAGSMTFKNDNTRTGIVMLITMLGSFFAGMMGVSMKYVIDKNIPIINTINPANMITDGFYSLYYYNALNRFYYDVISLLIFSAILILISYFLMRRKKYDSI